MTARRDALLLLAAALLPSAAMGGLGWRALRNEEAALRREAILEVSRQAENGAQAIHQRLEGGSTALSSASRDAAVTDDASQLDAYDRAARVTPAFAEALVLGADARLLLPRDTTNAGASTACAGAIRELASVERAKAARDTIVSGCEDARDARGRWLWPVLALRSLSDGDGDAGVLSDRMARWTEEYADRMRAEERSVMLEEVDRAGQLGASAKVRVVKALSGRTPKSSRVAPILARAMKTGTFARALTTPVPGSAQTFGGEGIMGAVVALEGGGFIGFVATPETLGRSLQRTDPANGIGAEYIATVVTQPDASGEIEGVSWVVEGLGIRVRPADASKLRVRTVSSERILIGLIAGGILLAVVMAYVLFVRLRSTRRTSELRTSFAAGVSHELRTPLASVRMLSELLAEGRVEEEERAEVAEALAAEAKRMTETLERLMAYAKSERGKLVATKESVDLVALLRARIAAFVKRNPGTKVVERGFEQEVFASVDPRQIEIVIDNLLENAKKYAPKGEPYEVALEQENGAARVAVSDRGPGVTRKVARRMFEAFERGDERLSKATSGTGLGLFLVRSIARAHGGDVSVGPGPEGGARFVVTLPHSTEDA